VHWANAHARGHHTGGPKADHTLTFTLDHSSGAAPVVQRAALLPSYVNIGF